MTCAGCGRANRPGARFCGCCGNPLAAHCPACGAENASDAHFCDACGAGLVARPTGNVEARKVVTIIFADLIGSTSLHERLDAESVRRLMDRYYRALHSAVEAHGGTVVKLLGDGVMAAFGVPRVAEDDAIRAVRAAVAMQHAFRELVQEQWGSFEGSPAIGLRVAVNTGEVVVSDDHADVVGDPVNVAARLQEEAHDGDVLIGESTRRLVSELVTLAPFGALALKGRVEKVAAYRVVSLDRPAGAPATPFVGRDEELRRLTTVYSSAVTARAARMAVILGSPGLGKSRLLDEFARRLGSEATVLSAHCDAAGGATFAPLAEAVRAHLGIDDGTSGDALSAAIAAMLPGDDAERARIAAGISALLAGTPAAPEETFFVVRRFLAACAASQPLVLAIDDLQWAEPLLLDLTEHLVQWSTDVPLLVLVAGRPELRAVRSSLAAPGSLVADVVTLAGLDAGAATRLAANVVGTDELPAALAGRVLATSEGNPLFVGELVRMLVHDGALVREGDRWTTGVALADLDMPPTIHALLAARIERLRPEDRTVLEHAAVVGRHFSRTAVAHLLPQETTDLDARLESLRRSELIEPDTGWFLGEPMLRFHHVLIRDAAYRRLLKGTRAELHGRFADWLESRVGTAIEHDETIGWHLEQAHQHLRELGPIDDLGRAFGERAARYLAAAGKRALTRDDLPLAASLLGRALNQLDRADWARADLALDWCEALLASGDVGPAAQAIDELARFIGGSDRLRAWHTCFTGQLAVLTDPQALRATADAVATAAEELASAGDAAGEAKAHSVHALALARLGKIGACEAALDRALAAARRAHDRRRANAVLAGAPPAALWGPSPVTRASGRCLDVIRVLRITQGAPAVEAVALRCQGVLEALRGRTDAARRMIASSRRMVEELGIMQRLLEADVFTGLVEWLEGNAVAAERYLRVAYDGFRSHGLGIDAAQAAAWLGRALLAQDRSSEAEALSHESEALAGDDLKAAIAWRGVRAAALARRGEHLAAIDFARAAVDIAAATDALLDHADARSTLASVLCAAGRNEEAATEEARAIELWQTKGATLLAERARRDAIGAPASAPLANDRAQLLRASLRRVRANGATASAALLDAALAARDTDALPALLADSVEMVHHPTGVVYDRQGALAAWYTLLQARDLHFAHEPLATLGDSLALFRTSVSFSALPERDVGPIGAASWDEVVLIEVDSRGQRRRVEFFTADKLGVAIARVYERYADGFPDGPERTRAAATACSIGALLGPPSLDAYTAAFAPDFEFIDERILGFGSGRGAELAMHIFELLFETSSDLVVTIDDILGLRPDALLTHFKLSALDRTGGGRYERDFLLLWIFGSDGVVTRSEQWDPDGEAEALARFDELTNEPSMARFTNAASQSQIAFERCWRARDWEALVALLAPNPELDDRRALAGLRLKGEDFLTNLQMLFATPSSQWHSTLLATRGERLALLRTRFTGEIGVGGYRADEHLSLVEQAADGRRNALVVFDVDDLEAAYVELDARFAAGEGAPYTQLLADWRAFRQAANARDWETARRLLPDDFTMLSHRRLANTGTHLSRDEFIASLSWGDDRGVRSTVRRDHLLRLSARALVEVVTLHGTLDGGDFEQQFIIVIGYDGSRPSSEAFDLDQLDAALARYDELTNAPTALPIENTATQPADRVPDLGAALDWEGYAAPEAAASRRTTLTRAFTQAFAARDWDALAALLAADLVVSDHRLLGWETLHGPAAYIHALKSLIDLAPDVRLRIDHVTMSGSRFLYVTTWVGTREGGRFESPSVILCELDAAGRIRRFDQYDVDRLDAVRAQFAALPQLRG